MGCSVSSLIEDSLRQALSRQTAGPTQDPIGLKTVSGRGLRPGVELDNAARLLDILQQMGDYSSGR
jgi:hypothetical protein